MFNTTATPCTRSTGSLWLALPALLLGLAPAAAQDRPLRAGTLAAASRTAGSDAALASSFEVDAVKSRLQPAAASDVRAAELAGINVRLWITQGRTDVGVGVDDFFLAAIPAEDTKSREARARRRRALGTEINCRPSPAG